MTVFIAVYARLACSLFESSGCSFFCKRQRIERDCTRVTQRVALLQLRRLLARATVLPTDPIDYELAAALYRQCRGNGEAVRKLIDCLIAAVGIRGDTAILRCDVLTRCTDLRSDAV